MNKTKIDEVIQSWNTALPDLNNEESQALRQVVQLLSFGIPIVLEQVANEYGTPLKTFKSMIEKCQSKGAGLEYNDNQEIVGFLGLSLTPTRHHFQINGKGLYTWCALDTLFLPAIIQQEARVTSECPSSESIIKLTVSPEGIKEYSPHDFVLSTVVLGKNGTSFEGGSAGST